MPLSFNTLLPSGARIWIWDVQETIEEVQKFIDDEDFLEICKIYHHPQRRLQKAITRILLNKLGAGKKVDIQYDGYGKPMPDTLPGSISISHSKHFVGLLYHPVHACGLDLEEPDQRVLRIAHRFLNDLEKAWIRPVEQLPDTCLVWSTKEALFKNIGGGGILFKDQLVVHEPTYINEQHGYGTAVYSGKTGPTAFDYHFDYLEGVLMVHTIAKESDL